MARGGDDGASGGGWWVMMSGGKGRNETIMRDEKGNMINR